MTEKTSLQIFRAHLRVNSVGLVDASGIFRVQCYQEWLRSRKSKLTHPEDTYRKTITAHIRGGDGRKPFHENEEEAILIELRKRRTWPCFKNTKKKIGLNGFRAKGYHEKFRESKTTNVNLIDRSCHTRSRASIMSSYDVFEKFGQPDSTGGCQILSKECYQLWISSRRSTPKCPAQSFRKALIAHLRGRDDRKPFPVHMEKSILKELNKEGVWPCFQDSTDPKERSIGKKRTTYNSYHQCKIDDLPIKRKSIEKMPNQRFKIQKTQCFDKFNVPESYLISTVTELVDFENVSIDEISSVLLLKQLCYPLFKRVYSSRSTYPRDIVGDVKLLRVLRSQDMNVTLAFQEIEHFTQWRIAYNIDDIRDNIMINNLNYNTFRKGIVFDDKNTFHPLYKQDENDYLIDVWRLIPQKPRTTREMEPLYLGHVKLCEYRNIVLDILSYKRKKILKYIVLYDWRAVRNDNPLFEVPRVSHTFLTWTNSIKVYTKHLKRIKEMYSRWYTGCCSKMYMFGNGLFFPLMASTVATTLIGPWDIVEYISNDKAIVKLLKQTLGEREEWPNILKNGMKDPRKTKLVQIKISDF